MKSSMHLQATCIKNVTNPSSEYNWFCITWVWCNVCIWYFNLFLIETGQDALDVYTVRRKLTDTKWYEFLQNVLYNKCILV